MNSRPLLALALASCATTVAPNPQPPASRPAVGAASAARAKPSFGSFGVDLDGRDLLIQPGADFYDYAGGTFMKREAIPADRSRWGMFDRLQEASLANVRDILEAKEQLTGDPKKAHDFYAAYLDVETIDKKGFAPARAGLDAIAAAQTHEDIARLMGRPDLQLSSPISTRVGLDQKNPDRYIVTVTHGGLGLPDREYYLKSEKQFVDIRAKYEAHIARVLAMVGDVQAQKHAHEILALETQIAERHWPRAERRERDKTYNLRTLTQLGVEAPQFPWKPYLTAAGFGAAREVVVRENSAMPKLGELFVATPVAQWKPYLIYHLLQTAAPVLPSTLDDEVFDFYSRTLNGQPKQRDRWKRAVQAVNEALGEAVGRTYVARFFKPNAKAEMDKLVENLRRAYATRIESVDWMTPETKQVALEKLRAFRPKIGYPSKWKDYSTLEVRPDDAYGNVIRAALWHHDEDVARLAKPSDRDEWFMNPQTVNAYYNSTFNEVVFPAAILQPPFFDPSADAAVNYGAIGAVIGHEMGHGFDDQGAKSDARGVLRTWWGPQDIDAFKKRTDALAEQYATYEVLPGIRINGRLTLGENIGDLGGLTVAYRAYQLSLDGKPAPVIEGFTGDQRFFLGWAQLWRASYRDEALRNQVMTDPHSPGRYRCSGVVRNLDAWYTAFGIKETDPLYLAPDQRVRIW